MDEGYCTECGSKNCNCQFTIENDDLRQKESERVMREEIEKTEWISVKDRLPEKEGYYLLHIHNISENKNGRLRTGYFYKSKSDNWFRIYPMNWKEVYHSSNEYIQYDLEGDQTKVTYWMPLPEPPKESK